MLDLVSLKLSIQSSWFLFQIVPEVTVPIVLDSISSKNWRSVSDGEMGAINGVRKSGKIITSNIQSDEFWVGTNYCLASLFMLEVRFWNQCVGTSPSLYWFIYIDFLVLTGNANKRIRSMQRCLQNRCWQHGLAVSNAGGLYSGKVLSITGLHEASSHLECSACSWNEEVAL